jgi:hypothetical protein
MIQHTMALVRKRRDAKRDAAMGRLAGAQQLLNNATQAWEQAVGLVNEAQAWRAELLARNGEGLHASWRLTTLPSCTALLTKRTHDVTRAMRSVEEHRRKVAEQRLALTRCEKALLRTDELQNILDEQDDERQRINEQTQEDDLATGYKGLVSAAAPTATPWK